MSEPNPTQTLDPDDIDDRNNPVDEGKFETGHNEQVADLPGFVITDGSDS